MSSTVQAARDHFDEIFSEFNTTMESEYDDEFEAPPLTAYLEENRAHEVHPHDKLDWFYGGSTSDSPPLANRPPFMGAELGRGARGKKTVGFFDDAHAEGRRHITGHVMGEESDLVPWRASPTAQLTKNPSIRQESETHANYQPPPSDWKKLPRAHAPRESLSFADGIFTAKGAPAPPPPTPPVDLERMRQEFHKEMSRLHAIDENSPAVSEYDAEYSPPTIQAVLNTTTASMATAPLRSTRLGSEYETAYKTALPEDFQAVNMIKPAGRPTKPTPIGHHIFSASTAEPWTSEYKTAFTDLEKRRVAESAALLAKAEKEAKQLADRATRERASNAKADAIRAALSVDTLPGSPSLADAALAAARKTSSTEYRDRFCHGGETSVLPDPGFVASPHSVIEHQQEPMLSEYNHEIEHLGVPKPAASGPPKHTYTPGYITEYEGSICGYDLRQNVNKLHNELNEIERTTILKPAYALKPERKHKHRLLNAETDRGYVVKSEYMRKYNDPFTIYNKHKFAHQQTAKLPDAKLDKADVTQAQANVVDTAEKKLGLKGPSKQLVLTPTHEELLEKASKENLKWWNVEGKRLWSTYNPVNLHPRWNPLGNYYKTPQTEYQRSFAQRPAK